MNYLIPIFVYAVFGYAFSIAAFAILVNDEVVSKVGLIHFLILTATWPIILLAFAFYVILDMAKR